MKKLLFFGCVILFVAACSPGRQIGRLANHNLLQTEALKNAHTGILIFDPSSSRMLYQYQSDKYFVPASNTKLVTCYAAMKYLGDSLPGIRYQILGDGSVLFEGTGDPTILHPDFQYQPVITFLKRFRTAHLAASNFNAFLGNGWSWNDYTEDYMAPRSQLPLYGNVVRIRKQDSISVMPPFFRPLVHDDTAARGFSVDRPWSQNVFQIGPGTGRAVNIPFVPADSTIVKLLADTIGVAVDLQPAQPASSNYVYTQTLDTMLRLMMHRSDNFYAEQTLLMVGGKILGVIDDRKILKHLLATDLSVLPQPPSWADGSGLSRYNLFSPQDFVKLLEMMREEFGMERLKHIFPTGGRGTLSSLYRQDSGYIFAKTGTLNGVVSLSGYLITRKNKLLIFSVVVNNHRSSATVIRRGIEAFLSGVRQRW